MEAWLQTYGLWFLAAALALELIALPIPGETLMVITGIYVGRGTFVWWAAIVAAAGGSIFGMTVAYVLGRLFGLPLLLRYGRYVHLTPERIERASGWFDRFGYPLIAVGYYIPGVRHLTGYFAGIMRLPFRLFALFAYGGALVWAATFISLGKWLGDRWILYHDAFKRYMWALGIASAVLLIAALLVRTYPAPFRRFALAVFGRLTRGARAVWRLRVRLAVLGVAAMLSAIGLVSLVEEVLEREIGPFDALFTDIALAMKEDLGGDWVALFRGFGTPAALAVLAAFVLFFEARRSTFGRAETVYTVVYFALSAAFGVWLADLWTLLVPFGVAWPNRLTFWTTAFWGFGVYIFVRQARRMAMYGVALGVWLVVSGSAAFAEVACLRAAPSAVLGGMLLGALWVVIHLIGLDVVIGWRGERRPKP
ncbi:MAG: DedA family protein [Hydrogenibacillus sp.]|nr:DedA family protein [Hydrogenibacillus sp.]